MYIKWLDGIKGLGSIAVLLCHYNMMFTTPEWFASGVVAKWLMSGGYAVALFIVISGFSAWLSVGRKIGDRKAIGKLVINRYLRFAVPFGIVFTILYVLWFLGCFNYHSQAGEISGSKALATAFWPIGISGFFKALLLSPVGADFWDAPLWMMKYIFLSTYIALTLRFATEGKRRFITMLILIATSMFFAFWDVFFWGVMLGIVLAYFFQSYGIKLHTIQKSIAGGGIFLLAIIARYHLPASIEAINFTSAALLLISFHFLPFIQRILEYRVLQYLGKISLGVYLWHWPVLCSMTSFVFVKTHNMSPAESFFITTAVTFLTILLVAHLSHKFIETRVSSYIIKRISNYIR